MFKVQYYTTKLESETNFETPLHDKKHLSYNGVKYTLLILSHLQFTSTDIPYITAREEPELMEDECIAK